MTDNGDEDIWAPVEQIVNDNGRTARIRQLNDRLRRTGFGGARYITSGIQQMGGKSIATIFELVANFDAFSDGNDTYEEHDFGAVTYRREKIFWKIDYYNTALSGGSPDPSDPVQTVRVMTVMLAQEY